MKSLLARITRKRAAPYKANKLTEAPMDEKLEWNYYELWHHEGRRTRHGASMSRPDYAWWHGMYDDLIPVHPARAAATFRV